MKKKATKKEREYMTYLANELGCQVCRNLYGEVTPGQIHHPRFAVGLSQRANHADSYCLCYNHHQGKEGIHTIGKKTWEDRYGTEHELLAKTKELMRWFKW